jgi:DNA-binding beta-propeller fold protein YncE
MIHSFEGLRRVATASALVLVLGLGLVLGASEGDASGDEGRLAITYGEQHRVALFAPDGTRLASVPTGLSPRGMAVMGNELFVANRGLNEAPGSSLTVIDLNTLQPVRTIYACVACAPYDLKFDAEEHLWFSAQADRAVYRMVPPYDGPQNSLLVSWGWPTQLALVEGMGKLVVGMRAGRDVALIDTRLNTIERVPLAQSPVAVAARPGKPQAWAAIAPPGQLARIEVRGDAGRPLTELMKIGNYPSDLRFLPDGERVLVSHGDPLGIALYDAEAGERRGLVELSSRPGAIEVLPSGRRAAALVPAEQRLVWIGISEDGELSEQGSFDVGGRPMRVLWIP